MIEGTPTLLLDGIWGRPRRFEGLLQMLRDRVGPAEIFRYNCTGAVPFDELGKRLADQINQYDRPVNLIGFSMGGLVIRAAHLLNPSLPIHRAAFLNTPHAGSILAYALPLRGIRQMQPTNAFIRQLRNTRWEIPTIASWCPLDTAVIPGRSARLQTANQTIRCAVPVHVWPVFSRHIWRSVVGFFATTDAPARAATACMKNVQ